MEAKTSSDLQLVDRKRVCKTSEETLMELAAQVENVISLRIMLQYKIKIKYKISLPTLHKINYSILSTSELPNHLIKKLFPNSGTLVHKKQHLRQTPNDRGPNEVPSTTGTQNSSRS